jgi:hypothetical protein
MSVQNRKMQDQRLTERRLGKQSQTDQSLVEFAEDPSGHRCGHHADIELSLACADTPALV